MSQADALRSIGPVQFDPVVTHAVLNPPIAQTPRVQDSFGDSTKLGQERIEIAAAAFLSRIADGQNQNCHPLTEYGCLFLSLFVN